MLKKALLICLIIILLVSSAGCVRTAALSSAKEKTPAGVFANTAVPDDKVGIAPFVVTPKQLEVRMDRPTDAEILAQNKEYIDYVRVTLGSEAANKVKADLLKPWENVPPEGKNITIQAVEVSMPK